MSKYNILADLELSLAKYRSCFDAADYVLAWDNGLAVKGINAVAVWDADSVAQNDDRRWLNGLNERASVKRRSDVAKNEYRKLCLLLSEIINLPTLREMQ